MTYNFKDLMALGPEAIGNGTEYRDYTNINESDIPAELKGLAPDQPTAKLATWILEKGIGKDLRLAMALAVQWMNVLASKAMQDAERMREDADAVIANATVDSEVILARGGKATLQARLDDTTAQLAQKVGGGKLASLNDFDEETINFIHDGTGGPINIESIPKDESVNKYKTTFAKTGKNIFNGNYTRGFGVIGGQGGAHISQNSSAIMVIEKISPGKVYSVSKSADTDRFRVGFTKSEPKLNDEVRLVHLRDELSIAGGLRSLDDEHYMVVVLSITERVPTWFQIEEGGTVTSYESPDTVKIALASNSVDAKAINFPIKGWLVGQAKSFVVSFEDNTITTSSEGGFVYDGTTQYSLRDGTYSFGDLGVNSLAVVFNKKNRQVEIHRASQTFEGDHLILGIIRVNEKKADFGGILTLEGLPEEPVEGKQPRITPIGGIPFGTYDFNVPDFNPYGNKDIETLYGIYEDLASDFPNQATMTFLRNEESGLPLYMYESKPLGSKAGKPYPKIIATVTHGHEVQATYGLAFAINEIMRNSMSNSILKAIKDNIHFIIVPQSNPYGFNREERPNFNGVDIARNYSAGWHRNDNPPEGYGTHGESPLSEVANQEMDKILREHSDAVFVLDNHNYGGDPFNDTYAPLMWVRGNSAQVDRVSDVHIKLMGEKARADGYVPLDITLGRYFPHNYEQLGYLEDQAQLYNMDALVLENMNTLNGSRTNENVLKFNVESVINVFATILRIYSGR